MREQPPGIQVNRVASGWLDDGDILLQQSLRQVGCLSQAIGQVALIQSFPQAHRHGVQVAPGQAAVGGKAFAQDQFIARPLVQRLVIHRQEAADVDNGILFSAHRGPIRQGKDLPGDLLRALIGIAWLAQLDEVRVLGKAAGVDKEGDAVTAIGG